MAQSNDSTAFKKPMALGSKSRSFIPMTPRSLKTSRDHQSDFARQVAEQTNPRGHDGQPPHKKFRSSAAPKGTKLASGYVDRAQERQREKDGDGEDKQKRLKALEDMLKLQQIDQDTFEALRGEIGIGGDTSTTHLVKGLDFKLLERIRRGDNVDEAAKEDIDEAVPEVDVEDELEKALGKDLTVQISSKSQDTSRDDDDQQTTTAETTKPAALISRNDLLQRLKQNRKKPDQIVTDPNPPQHVEQGQKLDQSRFRKLKTEPKAGKHKFTETINGRRREVLVITDKDGNTKRKTRWLDPEPVVSSTNNKSGADGNDHQSRWGGDLPAEVLARQKAAADEEAARQKALDEEEEEADIFGGVADYDPLAGIDSDEDEGDKDSTKPMTKDSSDRTNTEKTERAVESIPGTQQLKSTSRPRNYFSTTTNDEEPAEPDNNITSNHPSHDPSILAALKRAAQIRRQEEEEEEGADQTNPSGRQTQSPSQSRNQALLQKLQSQSGYNDDIDVDMGFGGGSRYDDEDDDGGEGGGGSSRQKLSQWKGLGEQQDDDEEDGGDGTGKKGGGGGGSKRKRGGEKKKGDKNSFRDVMSVIEGRKKT